MNTNHYYHMSPEDLAAAVVGHLEGEEKEEMIKVGFDQTNFLFKITLRKIISSRYRMDENFFIRNGAKTYRLQLHAGPPTHRIAEMYTNDTSNFIHCFAAMFCSIEDTKASLKDS